MVKVIRDGKVAFFFIGSMLCSPRDLQPGMHSPFFVMSTFRMFRLPFCIMSIFRMFRLPF